MTQEMIQCACGCGALRTRFDMKGRERRFVRGHDNRGKTIPIELRFWPFVKKTETCWFWTKQKDKDGYGKIWFEGKTVRTHRVSWMLDKGEMPPVDRMVLHSCDNPACVNPEHLSLGDVILNAQDALSRDRYRRGQTHSMSKLTEEDVREIRMLSEQGGTTRRQLADRFHTTPENINAIVRRRTWKHVRAA
jgi:hypothetical protein